MTAHEEFLFAVEHVKGGLGKRSYSCSDGWAVITPKRLVELEIAEESLATMTEAKDKALELLHKALPYVQFYDDQDHPAAVAASKVVCEELEDGITELEEAK